MPHNPKKKSTFKFDKKKAQSFAALNPGKKPSAVKAAPSKKKVPQININLPKKAKKKSSSTSQQTFNPVTQKDIDINASKLSQPPAGRLRESTPKEKLFSSPVVSSLAEFGQGVKDPFQSGIENNSGARSLGQLFGIGISLASITKGGGITTAVSKVGRIGTPGLYDFIKPGQVIRPLTAATFATNTKTVAQTGSWLTGLAKATTNPAFVATTIMAAIGTYPFAGFFVEEALQTLSFAVNDAFKLGDPKVIQEVLDQQRETVDKGLFGGIKAKVPFLNVIDKLDDFVEAAEIQISIQELRLEDLNDKLENGTTDAEIRAKRLEQENQAYRDNTIFSDDLKRQYKVWAREADIKARNEDAAFWRSEDRKEFEREAKDREAIADFWTEYNKAKSEAIQDNRPSKLNFGLI